MLLTACIKTESHPTLPIILYLLVTACLADNASILALKAVILAEFLLAALGNLEDAPAIPEAEAAAGILDVGGRGKVELAAVLLPPFGGGIEVFVRGRGSPRVSVAWAGVEIALEFSADVVTGLAGIAGGAIDILPVIASLAEAEVEAEDEVVVGLADKRLVVADPSAPNTLDVVVLLLLVGLVRADRAEEPVPG